MTRANGFFVNSPTTSGKKRKQKSLKLRRKEAMKKLLRRHNKSYAIDTYDKRRQQKKQIMGMPLPAWPLVPEEMLLSSKREEEHKASLFKTRALQERELLSQQFRASSTRVGLIPIVARTSLAPIEKQVSIVNDYNYYNQEGHFAAMQIQKLVRQKQSVTRKIKSFYISKIQRLFVSRMKYKRWRRSTNFDERVLFLTKRIIAETTRQVWNVVHFTAVDNASIASINRLRARNTIHRWWKSTWVVRLLRLMFSRSNASAVIALAWKQRKRRRLWRDLTQELVTKHKAIIVLQTMVRSIVAHNLYKTLATRLLRLQSALRIQCCFRRKLAYGVAKHRAELDANREVQWQVAVSNANKKMSIGDTALNTEEAILNLLMNGSCCTFTKRMQVEKSAERRTHTAFIKSKGSKKLKSPNKKTAPFRPKEYNKNRLRDSGVDCRYVSTDDLMDSLEGAIEEESSSKPNANLRYILSISMYIAHDDYKEAGKRLAEARSQDKSMVKFDKVRDDWINFALRRKVHEVDRTHLLHIAAIMNWHIYKRFDLSERLLYMALNESHEKHSQGMFLYPCTHGGDAANENRAKKSLMFLKGNLEREAVIDKGLISSKMIFSVKRRRVSGRDLGVRVFREGSNILFDTVECPKKKNKKKKKGKKKSKKETVNVIKEKRYMTVMTGKEVRDIVEYQLNRRDLLGGRQDEALGELLVKLLVLMPRQMKIVRAGQKPPLVLGFRLQKGIGEKYKNLTHETPAGVGLNVNLTLSADRNIWLHAEISYMPKSLKNYYFGVKSKVAKRSYGMYVKRETIETAFKDDFKQMKVFATSSWQTRCLPLFKKIVSMVDLVEREDNVGKSVSSMAIKVASSTMVEGEIFQKLHDMKTTAGVENGDLGTEKGSSNTGIRLQLAFDDLEKRVTDARKAFVAQKIQIFYRGWKGREKWKQTLRHKLARVIQRPYRRHLQRRHGASTEIQKHIRSYLAKRFVLKYLRVLDNDHHNIKFQHAWTEYLGSRRRMRNVKKRHRNPKRIGKKYYF
jgi:hypothetical protein